MISLQDDRQNLTVNLKALSPSKSISICGVVRNLVPLAAGKNARWTGTMPVHMREGRADLTSAAGRDDLAGT